MQRMQPIYYYACVLALFHLGSAAAQPLKTENKLPPPDLTGIEFFEKKIRPILVDRCYECHGTQAKKVKGGLLLDSRAGLLKGGTSGPAMVPGDPEKGTLIKAIRYADPELKMPPREREKKRLSAEQVADFVAWVKMGAPDPRTSPANPVQHLSGNDFSQARQFWAFQAVKDQPLPEVRWKEWSANPIDRFILAKLEANALKPGEAADKRTLIRRGTFDLIGLPPTPEEIDAFLADDSADAFARLVERLLASPHYGERWGRHWLDVVRYADTAGDNCDFPVPQAYRYRNYVLNSFNRDKPYDQFLREQIAGDLLSQKEGPAELPAEALKNQAEAHWRDLLNERESVAEKYEPIIATGYLAISRRYGVYPERYPHLMIEDVIETLGRSVLGLSLGCARCHDHKFDPIPTTDYYGLYGIFSSTRFPHTGSEQAEGMPYQKDFVPLAPAAEVEPVLQPFVQRLAVIQAEMDELYAKHVDVEPARKKRNTLIALRPALASAYAVSDGAPRNARVHKRGEPTKLGDEVPRRFLQVLGGQELAADAQSVSGRLQLGQWLTDPKNPLVARVMVNRIWLHHFGKGIVPTPNDFGTRGLPPTHAELLDYLAQRFIDSGWSIKAMHRLIMRSQVYQLASTDRADNTKIDPSNELLWKFNRRRLEAEAIRDAMLAVSGTLDRTMGGPHPFPAEKDWVKLNDGSPFSAVYETPRRSVYLMQQRLKKHPFLEVFDGASPNASTGQRLLSITPVQALFLMNNPFVLQQAAHLARRLLASRAINSERMQLAYQLTLGRLPSQDELNESKAYLHGFQEKLKTTGIPAQEQERTAWASYVQVLLGSNEFIFVD